MLIHVFRTKAILLYALIFGIGGCASNKYSLNTPIVSGEELKTYQQDLAMCKKTHLANQGSIGKGAIIGGAAGGVVRSAGDIADIASGAIIGAALGALTENVYQSRKDRNNIIQCMRSLGYNMAD